jgi:hypothetical protein
MERKISLKKLIAALLFWVIAEIIIGAVTGKWELVGMVWLGGFLVVISIYFGWGESVY